LNKIILTIIIAVLAYFALSSSFKSEEKVSSNSFAIEDGQKNIDGSVIYKKIEGSYTAYKVNEQLNTFKYNAGRAPTKEEIVAWDIDVRPDGIGYPKGSGNVDDGDELYSSKCSMCHGDFGAGGKGYPVLSGGEHEGLKHQLLDVQAGDEPPEKTIGTYWPYASTLWWYIKTAMPFTAPMSLSDDDVYAITAYLLNVNEVTFPDGSDIEELNQDNIKTIVMPNANGFYPDIRGNDAKDNLKSFMGDPKNYGKGKRCMSNCIKGDVPVVKIENEITGVKPPYSTERNLPNQKGGGNSKSKGQVLYENNCNSCHSNAAIAPKIGDKDGWKDKISQGKSILYNHAINGFGGMPPRGGTSLDDKSIKLIVDYIIKVSK
jgi:cytochrome c